MHRVLENGQGRGSDVHCTVVKRTHNSATHARNMRRQADRGPYSNQVQLAVDTEIIPNVSPSAHKLRDRRPASAGQAPVKASKSQNTDVPPRMLGLPLKREAMPVTALAAVEARARLAAAEKGAGGQPQLPPPPAGAFHNCATLQLLPESTAQG